MLGLPPSVQRLIRELSKLPSIGERSATRLAYFLLNSDPALAHGLSKSLEEAVALVRHCEKCFFFCEEQLCAICKDGGRDSAVLCVVEKPADVVAIERVGEFRGYYHVLHGLWSPLRGVTPDQLRLKELLGRIDRSDGGVKISEVILATSSTVEGDATAMLIARSLSERGVQTSRLAQGLPKGGELEFADEFTLSRAFRGRNVLAAA